MNFIIGLDLIAANIGVGIWCGGPIAVLNFIVAGVIAYQLGASV